MHYIRKYLDNTFDRKFAFLYLIAFFKRLKMWQKMISLMSAENKFAQSPSLWETFCFVSFFFFSHTWCFVSLPRVCIDFYQVFCSDKLNSSCWTKKILHFNFFPARFFFLLLPLPVGRCLRLLLLFLVGLRLLGHRS